MGVYTWKHLTRSGFECCNGGDLLLGVRVELGAGGTPVQGVKHCSPVPPGDVGDCAHVGTVSGNIGRPCVYRVVSGWYH